MDFTTIQIRPGTRERLGKFRQYRRETYDEILNRVLDAVPESDEEGEYTPEFRSSIIRGLSQVKKGKAVPLSEVKKSLGL